MTIATDRPSINGHRIEPPLEHPITNATQDAPGSRETPTVGTNASRLAVPESFAGMPSAAELHELRHRAAEAGEVQQAPEIRDWMSWDEITASQDRARLHRTAMGEVEAARNALESEHALRMLKTQAERNEFEAQQARRELATEQAIAKSKQRDQLDAIKAKDQLRKLSSTVAFLGAQYRARRLSLSLAISPAVAGVVAGTVQAQNAWSHVLGVTASNPVFWVLFLLEGLATAPLVAILIYQAGKPGGSAAAIRQAFAELRKEKFSGFGAFLLGMSVFINVGPHVILREWPGLIWLWVPVAVALSLSLLPRLAAAFNERILTAKTDAELSAPVGQLSPEQTKLIRQMRAAKEAELAGALRSQEGETTAGAGAIRKILAAAHGSCGMPDAIATRDALRLYRSGDQK